MKYARGEPPRDLGHYSAEAANSIALYGTPEYFMAPQQFSTHEFPLPNWKLPVGQREDVVSRTSAWWLANQNHESGEPPLYYAIAGFWLDLGRLFGVKAAWLLYWVRFLNVFIAGTLVWIGFLAAKLVFPNRQFVYFGVPILLAVWPQTTFYSIQSDLLSPLCFGIAFIGLIKFLRAQPPSLALALWTGLALAATCLVKTANIALLLVIPIALIVKMQKLSAKSTLRLLLVPFAGLIISAGVPLAAWFVWNYNTFGDLTATASKIDFLGWIRKPISNWWPHPIFTPNGLKEFWPELMASFWRGEFIWQGKRLASQTSDAFYWISSTLAIGLAMISLFPRLTKLTDVEREGLWLALSTFAVLVLFVALLSMAFDFGLCPYPSREHPYFTSGRLLSAAAVPFFLVYSQALDWLFSSIPRMWPRMILLGGIVLFILGSESDINRPTFSSDYNWFHLP